MDDSSPSHDHSVTRVLEQLKNDNEQAAAKLWTRYFNRLLPLARAKIKDLPNQAVDEEDVLISVFDRFFRAVKNDRFARLDDRDDLWQILLVLTDRKATDEFRRATAGKRGEGRVANEAEYPNLNLAEIRELTERQPTPEYIAAFNDHLARAIDRLADGTREVAPLKLDGHENKEIAKHLEISVSSIERKLRVIREIWRKEFAE